MADFVALKKKKSRILTLTSIQTIPFDICESLRVYVLQHKGCLGEFRCASIFYIYLHLYIHSREH